jgi:hypothetical protein
MPGLLDGNSVNRKSWFGHSWVSTLFELIRSASNELSPEDTYNVVSTEVMDVYALFARKLWRNIANITKPRQA